MALSGVHVACGYAGSNDYRDQDVAILGECVWSQTFASGSPGTTTNSAPKADPDRSQAVFSIDTTIDIFFAVGPAPDASASPRRFLAAGKSIDVFAKFGNKLAWIAA